MRHTHIIGICIAMLVLGILLSGGFMSLQAANQEEIFASPDDAVKAFLEACKTNDEPGLLKIFGPESNDIVITADKAMVKENRRKLYDGVQEKLALRDLEGGKKKLVVIGHQAWVFPIPLVKESAGWRFDTAAGKDEIINRRVGMDELNAIAVCRAYVSAQRDYAGRDWNGDEVLEYAQRLGSSPGKKDGLYWPSDPAKKEVASPFGPLLAEKQGTLKQGSPYHGYYFRILTTQGSNVPGGAYSYIINGHMIGGFALIAWPAEHGSLGVMTFMVNQQGKVYQKDLGRETLKVAGEIKEYNPDSTWKLVDDGTMTGR